MKPHYIVSYQALKLRVKFANRDCPCWYPNEKYFESLESAIRYVKSIANADGYRFLSLRYVG